MIWVAALMVNAFNFEAISSLGSRIRRFHTPGTHRQEGEKRTTWSQVRIMETYHSFSEPTQKAVNRLLT